MWLTLLLILVYFYLTKYVSCSYPCNKNENKKLLLLLLLLYVAGNIAALTLTLSVNGSLYPGKKKCWFGTFRWMRRSRVLCGFPGYTYQSPTWLRSYRPRVVRTVGLWINLHSTLQSPSSQQRKMWTRGPIKVSLWLRSRSIMPCFHFFRSALYKIDFYVTFGLWLKVSKVHLDNVKHIGDLHLLLNMPMMHTDLWMKVSEGPSHWYIGRCAPSAK